MASLASLSKKLKEKFDLEVGSKTYKALDALDRYNKAFTNPKKIDILPNLDQTKVRNIPLNMAAGATEYLVNEPRHQIGDIGVGLNKLITKDTNNFNPNSSLFKLTNSVMDMATTRQNPLSTVQLKGKQGIGYGKGKWEVPFTNINIPEMGFSESPLAKMGGQALDVAAPFAAVKGAAKPFAAGAYTALGGVFNTGISALSGDTNYKKNFIEGANTTARKSAAFTGFSNATNPLLDAIGGKALTRLPLKSAANVAQGIGLDQTTDMETTPESLLLDALFPLAGELKTKSFKSADEAIRVTEARLKSALGKSMRNNKGMYTTADKFAKGTRAYRKSGKYMQGGLLGFEPYQDEDGSWKVRFNRERALVGLGVGLGMTKSVSNGNYKDLADSLNRTQFKNLDQATKDAVLEEAQRMLAGGIGDTGVIGNARYSANPDWYRDFYKQTGKAPSNEEFFDMALSRVKPQESGNIDDIIKSWGDEMAGDTPVTKVPDLATSLGQKQLGQANQVGTIDQSVETPRQQVNPADTLPENKQSATQSKQRIEKEQLQVDEQSSLENIVRQMNTPVNKKIGLIDYMRTPSHVLDKIGLGKQAKALDKAHNAYLDELPKEIDRITEWYKRAPSPESAVNIFKHLDGQKVTLDQNEAQVAKEIREYLVGWADRLDLPKDSRITNYITHIFDEQLIKKEFDDDLAKIIQDNVAGSVYDPFTLERLGALGYKENVWDALDAYVKRGVRKVNMDPALEQVKKAADSLEVSQFDYVKSYVDRINMRPTKIDNLLDNTAKQMFGYRLGGRPTARVSKLARQMVYRGTLGLNVGSALRNLTQGVNTYAELGEKYTVLGYTNLLKNGTKELDEVGLFRNGMVEDRSLNATKKFWEKTDKVLFSFFEAAERINRGSAYYGAKAKGLSKGMSEEQARQYAVDIVKKTQFTFGKIDTPVALQSDIAKLLLQFQSYNVKQIEFLVDKVKAKDVAGLARYSIGSFVMLNTIGQLLGMDYKDLIPKVKIGASPVFSNGRDIIQSITGGEDDFGNELSPEDRAKMAGNAVVPFIPAGVQGKKTIGGALDLNRGYKQTKSGNVQVPLNQTPANWLRGVTFGTNTLPEVQDHWDAGTRALSEKQSQEFRNSTDRKGFYDAILQGREESNQNDIVRERVAQSGQEETSNGRLFYMGNETDSKTGEIKKVVKSLDVSDISDTQVGGVTIGTREKDGFPFPDYVRSTAGQTLRADLNFSGQGTADIVFHMKLPNGKTIDVPQTVETVDGENSYGLELAIPKDAGTGKGQVWVTVNGEEVAGTRKDHEIIAGSPVDRYDRDSQNRYFGQMDSTFEQASSLGKYIITTETGNKAIVDLSKPLEKPKTTGQKELDKELVSRYNSSITTRINNIEKVYLDGQITAEEAEKAISELKAKKISTGKAKKKGVSVSMPKITFAKADAISKTNIKPSTFKLKKAPKLKLSSAPTRKATIKLAKKSYAKGKPIKFKNTLSESLTKLA